MKKRAVIAGLVLILLPVMVLAAQSQKAEGGAVQLKGFEGKTGVMLFNGHTRLKVTGVDFPAVGPKGELPEQNGYMWFRVNVAMKNGDPQNATYGGGGHFLTVVDQKNRLFKTRDMLNKDDWNESDNEYELLPGAGMSGFYVVAIPSDSIPKRLVIETGPTYGHPVFRVTLPNLSQPAANARLKAEQRAAGAAEKTEEKTEEPKSESKPQITLPTLPELPFSE